MLLKDSIHRALAPIFNERGGKAFAAIAINWAQIVGLEFAYLVPIKLEYGLSMDQQGACLHLELLDRARIVHANFHHTEIIRRLKLYFGFDIVSQLKIKCRQ